MKKIINYICIITLGLTSCNKYVDVDLPKDQILNKLAFSDDRTATASMVGAYSDMNALNYNFANVLTSFLGGMSADEFYYASNFAAYAEFMENSPTSTNNFINTLWNQPYSYIYHANACIEGLGKATGLSEPVKKHLMGEARFLRAFNYFYLVEMFGDVPLVLDTDYLKNTQLPRAAKSEVINIIIQDLEDAKAMMSSTYVKGAVVDAPSGAERIRPNSLVASALLARVYLYKGEYSKAVAEATRVLNDKQYKLLASDDMNKVFLKNSEETLWQLQSINITGGRNTWEGNQIVPTAAPLYRLLEGGVKDIFEENDLRKKNWTAAYTAANGTVYLYPYKYKVRISTSATSEYSMVMRLSEQYLIRAEAQIQLRNTAAAIQDLNVVRQRAGLTALDLSLTDQQAWLAMEKERQTELFTEWGHRWFDLIRWKGIEGKDTRADEVLPKIKKNWKTHAKLFPLPLKALQTNRNLTQNDGYN